MSSPPLPSQLTARDGVTLHLSHWPAAAPRGVVVLLHGLTEHAQRYSDVARFLNDLDWAVVAPDLRGHGRSGGPRGGLNQDDDLLFDLAQVLDAADACYPAQPRVLLGNSMGGALAARFAAAQALPREAVPWARAVDGLILSSPALQPTMSLIQRALLSTMGRLIQDLPVPVAFKPEWVSSNPAVIEAFNTDPLIHRQITPRVALFMAGQGPLVQRRAPAWTTPTLMLYTPDDRLVMPQGCTRFMAELPDGLGRTCAFPGLLHDLFHEPDAARVLQALQQWLLDTFAA